jgi:hypothetical protein
MNTNSVINTVTATGNPVMGGLILLVVAIVAIVSAIALFKLFKTKNSN